MQHTNQQKNDIEYIELFIKFINVWQSPFLCDHLNVLNLSQTWLLPHGLQCTSVLNYGLSDPVSSLGL